MTVSSFTQRSILYNVERRFLYYYSSVILNLSKNSFFMEESCKQLFLLLLPSESLLNLVLLEVSLFLESGCKGTTFSDTTKTFPRKIHVFIALFLIVLQNNASPCADTLLYNIKTFQYGAY